VRVTVQDLSRLAVLGYDADGTLRFWNRGCERLLGWTTAEALGRRIGELVADPADPTSLAALLGGQDRFPGAGICRLKQRNGQRLAAVLLPASAAPPGGPGTIHYGILTPLSGGDSPPARTAAHHVQSHTLESLAVLAGGIAHDFNNLLLGVVGNADLVLTELDADHPARGWVEQIAQAGLRAADLCQQLLAFSGKGKIRVEPLDVTDLIRSVAPLLHLGLGTARLRLDLAPDLPIVEADAAQIRQVVMNLVTNASEALPDRTGTIEIRTRLYDAAREPLHDPVNHQPLAPGSYVAIDVRDDGVGMTPEQAARAFEPFYTTKFMGRGLGLAAIQGIARAHHGAVAVQTAAGEGSTFTVFLPTLGVRSRQAGAVAVPRAAVSRPAGRLRARILVVDDEHNIRQVAGNLLAAAGYEILLAADGSEALAVLEDDPHAIDLVLLDMTMPGLHGLQVLDRIRGLRVDLPVLLSSGYGRENVDHVLGTDEASGFIQKPYRRHELLRSTASLLERRAPGPE